MKKLPLLAASMLIFLVYSCITIKAENITTDGKSIKTVNTKLQDSLAFELCKLYGSDQGLRDPYIYGGKVGWAYVQKIDSINFKKLVAFVKDNGFPTKKLLGEKNYSHECVEAAAIAILLHTPHILVKDKEYFNVFLNEVKKGNLKAEMYATILDKYYWVKKGNNHRVLYGSQFGMPCKAMREESNKARAEIGLAPLADSLFVDCD